jgi:CspA family cold shock protein
MSLAGLIRKAQGRGRWSPASAKMKESELRELLDRRSVTSGIDPSLWVRYRLVLLNTLEMGMSTGTVKWFNPTKGYGFIQPQGGGQDVFVHISAVERAGLSTLNEGQQVEYEIVSNRGKSSAENLKVK